MKKLIVAFMAFALLPCSTEAQQRADPKFSANISRPAYAVDGPVVAIDQAHRNFHTMDGGYAPFAELLTADGYRLRPLSNPFTIQTLADVNVLVIANARGVTAEASAFDPKEIAVLREWVNQGGSLFLISDHKPFGTAASRLAEAFGVNMGGGYVVARSGGRIGSQIIFEKDRLGSHVILRGRNDSERLGKAKSFTGQSLSVPTGATALLALPSDALEVASADEAQELARGGRVPARSASGRAQAIAMTFGKGRVVVAGEAAMYTEQIVPGIGRIGIRQQDDQQFTLNVLHWLSRLIS